MPPLAVQLLVFLAGLIVLAVGAELFIRGAVRVARRFGVSPFVIGLTLVGFGTSAPELVVNVAAAWNDTTDLALGNVVGSNIANVGLILGIAAVVRPMVGHMRLLKVEMPVMLGVCALLWIMAQDDEIRRWHGLALLAGFVVFLGFTARQTPAEPPEVKAEFGHAVPTTPRGWLSGVMLVVGLAGLIGGAQLMVDSATEVAKTLGVPELVIGLTVVAIGTSLPELASSVAAAYRGESDIALGNVVGSNIFNILLILGVTAQVRPLPVSDPLRTIDLPVMVGFALLLMAVLANGLRVHRWEGVVLLAAYFAYVGWQVTQSG